MASGSVNVVAVVVASIASMLVGALWYSPLMFGTTWKRLMELPEKKAKELKKRSSSSYSFAFLSSLVASLVLYFAISSLGAAGVAQGMAVGFWVWLGFVATTQLGAVLWEGKPFELYALNATYSLVSFVVMGAILGASL